LLDDHVSQVAEEVGKFGDGLSDGGEFLGALVDLGVEGVGGRKLGLELILGLRSGKEGREGGEVRRRKRRRNVGVKKRRAKLTACKSSCSAS